MGEPVYLEEIILEADTSELILAIADAQSIYDNAVVGPNVGNFSLNDKNTFHTAIESAQTASNNTAATEVTVSQAKTVLVATMSAFQAKALTVAIPVGTVTGYVYAYATHAGFADVTVSVYTIQTGILVGTAITDSNGAYTIINVPVGPFYLKVEKTGYVSANIYQSQSVIENQITDAHNYELAYTNAFGNITDVNGASLGATVTITINSVSYSPDTYYNKQFNYFNLPSGSGELVISKPGYITQTKQISIETGVLKPLGDFILITT